MIAMLQRIDGKKFPKKPQDLWSKSGQEEAAPDFLVAQAKAMHAAAERDKRRKGKGKAAVVIHREE